jgi:hypothetical protein
MEPGPPPGSLGHLPHPPNMSVSMFTGSRLKIERAKKHINDLHSEIISFSNSDFYAITIEKHPDTGNDTPKLRITKPIPEGLALIIGDSIHNLRTALDLAVCEVVRDKLGSTTKYTKFPFDDISRENFIRRFKTADITKASPAIFDLIVDVEPYKGGSDALYALHELDILDKHELLIPVIELSVVLGISAKDDVGGHVVNLNTFVSPNSEWLQTGLTGNAQIESYGKAIFVVGFAKDSPACAGSIVLPVLKQFVEMVTGIIDAFETILRRV